MHHASNKQKKVDAAVLTSSKTCFKVTVTRDRKGHFIMKNILLQEKITILNEYILNSRGSK